MNGRFVSKTNYGMNIQKTIIMIDIVGLESIGKYVIGLWSKYVKRKHIPYMDLEFHYPNYLFIALGSIIAAIILGIAIAYFSIK